VSQDFQPLVFSSNNPIWAPDSWVKYGFEFENIKNKVGASAVPMTLLRPIQWYQCHRCGQHCGFSYANLVQNHTVKLWH
jgi:hypothetical protein